MSYQEYAKLGRNTNTQRNYQDASRPPPPRIRTDRPYTGSVASFSVPRKTTPSPNHSTSSSTSSASLSPSNSASQKAGNLTPTSQWSDGRHTGKQLELGIGMGAEKRPDLIHVELPWRPFYLQRKILICFAVAFAGLAICLEALLGESSKRLGFGQVSQVGYYLWRLAPTALLTLTAVLWSRVEYQAKHAAPWLRMSRGEPADAERTLLLDYVSMSQPWSVVKAVRNRDYAVAAATIVSLFLQLLVVASTGLMYMSLVDTQGQVVPVTLTTAFVNNGSGLANAGTLAFYTMLGLQQEDLLFPDGVSAGFAYQQFTADAPPGSMVRATVDGLSAGLECEAATLNLAGVQSSGDSQQLNTSFSSANGCNISMPISGTGFLRSGGNNETAYFARFGQGGCGGSSNATEQRIVVVFGTETINPRPIPTNAASTNVVVNGSIPRSASLICKPIYSVSRIDVSKKDDIVMSVGPSAEAQNRALANVEAWGIADAFFASFRNELADTYANTTPWFYEPSFVNVDAVMYLALDFRFRTAGVAIAPDALLDPDILEDVVGDYFQQYVPLLASRALVHSVSSPATATAEISGERLVVSFAVTQFLVVHLAVNFFLTVGMMLIVPKKGFLPRDPGTIMDTAALIANSRDLLQTLRGLGGADAASLREKLAQSHFYTGVEAYERVNSASEKGYYKIFGTQAATVEKSSYTEPAEKFPYPTLLHPIARLLSLLLITGIIIGLDFTLQSSNKNGGFDDVSDQEPRHLLWTILPAAILAHVAWYFISAGFELRILAPYAALTRGATFEQSVGLNIADRSPPMVLYEAIKLRNLAVGGASLAAFGAALFTMFAATLFTAATVPIEASCQLLTRDFFSQSNTVPDGFCTDCQNGTVLASLILNGNVSDPPFTYNDLVFPSVVLDDVPEGMRQLPDDVVVASIIPAVRPSLACRSFQSSELAVNLSLSSGLAGTGNPMMITLPAAAGGVTIDDNTVVVNTGYNLNDLANLPALDANAFFGTGTYKPIATPNGALSRWIWVWGQLQNAGTDQTTVRTISAMTCNETVTQLNVFVRFLGDAMDIDQASPPFPDESSGVPVPVAIDGNLHYEDLVTADSPHLLDPFFMSLVSSRLAIPLLDLGNGAATTAVGDAIAQQHRLIRAQIINSWNRRPTATPAPETNEGNATVMSFPARLRISSLNSGAARRVVQDMISTRILQALLAAVLVTSTASWLALPKANIIPRSSSPGSIASVASLLAEGNIFGLLGRGTEWQSANEIRGYFRDGLHVTMGFQLGWEKARRRRREINWAAAGNDDEVFAISAIRTGGWGGGENVGLGLQARVGYAHREHVRDWGWRT